MDRSVEEVVGRHHLCQLHSFGQLLAGLFEEGVNLLVYRCGIGTGRLEHQAAHTRMAVQHTYVGVVFTSQVDVGHLLQLQHFAVSGRGHHHLAKLLGCITTSAKLHGILVGLGRILAKRTGSGLNVLFGQHAGDVRRYQSVLCHHVGLQPEAHGVVGTQHHQFTYTLKTEDFRFQVDVEVVGQKTLIIRVVGAMQAEHLQHGGLTLYGGHTHLLHLGRQLGRGRRDLVLYVHRRHVGVGALLEIHRNGDGTRVAGGRGHVGHVLHTVDGLFQRSNHTFLQGFGTSTVVVGHHHHRRRRNVRILFDGQRKQPDDAQDNDGHRDDRRQDGTFDKCS